MLVVRTVTVLTASLPQSSTVLVQAFQSGGSRGSRSSSGWGGSSTRGNAFFYGMIAPSSRGCPPSQPLDPSIVDERIYNQRHSRGSLSYPLPTLGVPHFTSRKTLRLHSSYSSSSSQSPRLDYLSSSRRGGSSDPDPDDDDDDNNADDPTDDDDDKMGWLRWMRGGKPRGTHRVVLREAPELGGVPRSDRYSSKDWWHNTITLPNSAILRDVRSPVLACTAWATFLSVIHSHLRRFHPTWASHLYMSGAPHSLTMSALGLLLVFRTNSAYQRFVDGREVWERIINTSRDLYRYITLYEHELTIERRKRVQRLLAAFPYLLRHRIRPNLIMRRLDDERYPRDPRHALLLYQDFGVSDLDLEAAAVAQTEETTGQSRRKTRPLYWVDRRTLPWRLLEGAGGGGDSHNPAGGPGMGGGTTALEKCARAQNRPLWVCDRMAQELRSVPDSPTFTARERLAMVGLVDKLSHCIGGAERIHQTVVPLNYARHTLRALTLWLVSLPFALLQDLQLLTGPVLFLVSWLLFGVYEIGVRIEDPFQGTLRLSIMCDTVRRDVLADESIRSTAFALESMDNPEAQSESGALFFTVSTTAPSTSSSSSAAALAIPDLLREDDGEDDELTESDFRVDDNENENGNANANAIANGDDANGSSGSPSSSSPDGAAEEATNGAGTPTPSGVGNNVIVRDELRP